MERKCFSDKSADPALWVQHKWEDLIIKLLAKTIDEINDDEWNTQLGEEMCKQFQLYVAYPQQKVYSCSRIIISLIQKKKKNSRCCSSVSVSCCKNRRRRRLSVTSWTSCSTLSTTMSPTTVMAVLLATARVP